MTINCKGTLIDLSTPKVMGILNLTPDSFFDGGKYQNEKSIIEKVDKMINEGATFIDVGAYSSRPNAIHISEEEELKRLIPTLKLLFKTFPELLISVDTFRSKVALASVENGACMINDISAGEMDEKMFETVAKLQVPYILMHMKGTPQNMYKNPTYENIILEIMSYFSEKIYQLRKLGLNDLIIDVGFGFGKTLEHNYQLLQNLDYFKHLNIPILTGISRKSMLQKPLNITADEALNATTVANTIALLKGSSILRVHDVKEAVEAVKITSLLNQ
ncbi:MAG TPA: dihydropteroate synthase [Flavobacteriaceae bacterium]|nr:dihydropteroate synthase [Flavobacteriaceae bacterium]